MRFHRLALVALAAVLSVGTPLYGGNNAFALADEAASDAPDTSATAEYSPPEGAESFEFEAEVHRMLDIVVNSLYQNKDVFLRELISNASDALDKVRFIALTKPEYMEGKPELEVRIEYDEEAKTLTVRDSGIGMTHDDLVKNLGTVARSGTTKFIEAMGEGSADMGMIGQFGVGFYSTFLIADRVSVASKHPESDEQYIWESSNGESSFFVGKDPRGNTLGRGTEITLHLKEDAEEYAAGDRVRNLAKYYSEFVTHPIHLRTSKMTEVEIEDEESEESEAEEKKEEGEEGEEKEEKDDLEIDEEEDAEEEKPKKTKEVLTHSWEEVNSEQAIWTRSKDEITDEEYNGFWKNVNKNANSDAASWIHFNAEGNINFKSLLYLPSDVPQSLMQGNFDTERKGGLKLYVRKVLISDEFELMPKYLSFIKGVVDSDDLPLNVNRETLQESKIIKVISKKLVRKALEMLRKLADKDKAPAKKEEDEEKEVELDDEGNIVETVEDEDDEEDEIDRPKPYLEWYKKFAPSLKMGVIEDEANRGKLAKLLRFKSSKTEGEDEYISLPEYIERMKDWQDDVYVFAGQNIDELEKSHFMEQFLEKDVEVLYLTDPVDEYMTQAMRDFEGKKFTAISKEGIKFKDEDEDMVKRREKAYKKKFKPLTKWLNKLYGPNVMRVSISKRLGKAPAIVSSAEYGHSANMERIMRAQAFQHGQDEMMMRAMRVLEINPRHPFIEKLLEGIPAGEDAAEDYQAEENTMDAAWLLYDMALMNGGFPISDAKEYSARMMKVLKMVMDVDELTLSEEISPAEEEDEPPEVDMDGNEGINLEDFNLDDFSDEFEGADI